MNDPQSGAGRRTDAPRVRARLVRAVRLSTVARARALIGLGAAVTSVGTGLVYVPAGVIVAGLALLLAGLLLVDL